MTIRHNSYFDGMVQSLGFTSNETDYTVGVIEPGKYEFEAVRYEKIQVVFGSLEDLRSGRCYGSHVNPEHTLPQFRPGEKVRLACDTVVVYICRYDDTPFPA